jgi:dTDP-4-dehydrorhamnose reductase
METNASIVVLGATGMLGTALVYQLRQAGHRVWPVDRSHLDAAHLDAGDPLSRLELEGVDYVVNALGLINRRLPSGALDFYLVNSLFPRLLADHCQARDVRLIHISTDCVFDGHGAPHTEDDEPTASDLYGRSKALGEPANCLVLRTSIIGPERHNHYSLLSWLLAQSGTCHGYRNHAWNGMTTIQLSRIVDQIVRRDLYCHGRRHVFSRDTTKLEVLQLIQAAYRHPIEIVAWDDVNGRDTRLRTIYARFIQPLEIADLADQIAELPHLSDERGRWRELPELGP